MQSDPKPRASALPIFSMCLADGSLVEIVYRPDEGRTMFVVGKEDAFCFETSVTVSGIEYVPYSALNNLLEHDVVLLPSGPEAYDSQAALVAEIQAFIHRYVDVSPLYERIASYYVLLTWVYDAFNELPYLRLRGDPGSGKTRFLTTVGSLCYKPIFASGASTVSPLFRILDIVRGTLIIDEGDFRFSDERAEIAKILNQGNAKGFPVLRSEMNRQKEFNPRAYAVFGPKIVATRGFFQDRALESRCLTEEMGQCGLRDDIPITLPPTCKADALTIRNKLLMFRIHNLHKCAAVEGIVDRRIEPRLSQVFLPLLSIIDDERARAELLDLAAAYDRDMLTDREMDTEAQVLEVICDMRAGGEKLVIKEIAKRFSAEFGSDYDHKISPKWMGSIVRRRLRLKTEKSHGVFLVPVTEYPKLNRLNERFGVEESSCEAKPSAGGYVDVGDVPPAVRSLTG